MISPDLNALSLAKENQGTEVEVEAEERKKKFTSLMSGIYSMMQEWNKMELAQSIMQILVL